MPRILRTLSLALFALSATALLSAQARDLEPAPNDGHVAVPLWPGAAPGALGTAASDIPTLTAYLPESNPTHTAIIVAPGGGYVRLAADHEGAQIGVWLAAHGIAAYVLHYRVGPRYLHPIELGDARRALRTVRSNAAANGIDPHKIGMWGFSAGGHLAATLGTQFDAGDPAASDPIDRASSRPDFLILAYPLISFVRATHPGSVTNLIGDAATPEQRAAVSAELHVTNQTPPTFLFSTEDDASVPVINSLMFYEALLEHHVSAEIHIFRHGRHGSGLAKADPDLSLWTTLLLHWLAANGWASAIAP
jgi:acetyl esterase/lipase